MNVTYSIAIFCAIFFTLSSYVIAHQYVKREASPYAEPGVGKEVGKYCNRTMVGATSHQQFCESVSKEINEKVNFACVKSVKVITKVFKKQSKDKYRAWLIEHICPSVVTQPPAPVEENDSSDQVQGRFHFIKNHGDSEDDDDEDNVIPLGVLRCGKKRFGWSVDIEDDANNDYCISNDNDDL